MFKKKKKIGEKECIWNLEHFRNCIWKKDLFSRLNFEFKFWNFVDLGQLGNLKWTYGLIYPFTMFILPLQSSGWLSELLFGCDFVRDRFSMWYVVIDRSSESLTGKTRWKKYCWVTVSLYLSPQHCQILSYA